MNGLNIYLTLFVMLLAGLGIAQTSPEQPFESKAHLIKAWLKETPQGREVGQSMDKAGYEESKYYNYSQAHGVDSTAAATAKGLQKKFPKLKNPDLVENFDARRLKNAQAAVDSASRNQQDLNTALKKVKQRRRSFSDTANKAKTQEKALRGEIKQTYKQLDSAGKLNAKNRQHLNKLGQARSRAQARHQFFSSQKKAMDVNAMQAKVKRNQEFLNKQRANLDRMKASMNRAGKAQKGVFWTQIIMAAYDVQKTEEARAKREGRSMRASNQLWDFTKRVSGYASYEGLYEQTQLAVMESLINQLEEYDRLGFDISDKDVFNRAVAHAMRAGVKQGMYEGAKLVPGLGDAIAGKEMFDAAGEYYVAAEELQSTEAVNSNEQYQMWMRAARKAQIAADRIDLAARVTRQRISEMQKAGKDVVEYVDQADSLIRKQQEAVGVIEKYREQQAAMQKNPAAGLLGEDSQKAILEKIKTANSETLKHIANAGRVKNEYESKKISAKGVATNVKFISDLIEPTVDSCKNIDASLNELKVLAKGSELADKLPQAVQIAKETKDQLDELREKSRKMTVGYLAAADELEVVLKQYEDAKKLLANTFDFVDAMTDKLPRSINPAAYEKIVKARVRGAEATIDTSKAKAMIAKAHGLSNDNKRVAALAGLTKMPSLDANADDALMVRQAQEVLKKLDAPAAELARNMQRFNAAMADLRAIAGDETPVDIAEKVKDAPVKRLSQRELYEVTGDQLAKEVAGALKDGQYKVQNRKTWAGFIVNPETSQQITARIKKQSENLDTPAEFVPYAPYYRLVKKGEVDIWYDMNQNDQQDSDEPTRTVPYWIYYVLYINCTDYRWGYYVKKDGVMKSCQDAYDRFMNPKGSATTSYQTSLHKITIPGAELAAAGVVTGTHKIGENVSVTKNAYAFAAAGCFSIQTTVDTVLQIDRMIVTGSSYGSAYTYGGFIEKARKDWPSAGPVFKDFEFYISGRPDVAAESLEKLVQVVRPYNDFSRANFIIAAEPIMPAMSGFTCTTNVKPREHFTQYIGRSFKRSWAAFTRKGHTKADTGRENYSIYISCITPSYKKSWLDALNECDKDVAEYRRNYKNQTSFATGLRGVRKDKALRGKINEYKTPESSSAGGRVLYSMSEYIVFTVDNVVVKIDGYGNYLPEAKLRTAEVAQRIVEKIKSIKAKNKAKY